MPLFLAPAAMIGLACLVPLLDRRLGRNTGYVLAAGFLIVGALLWGRAPGGADEPVVTTELPWLPALGVTAELRLDGLAAMFCLLILGVGALIMAYCARYLSEHGNHRAVYTLLTLFAGAMLGLVMASDIILLVVFWELTTICSYFLIGDAGPHAVRAARKAFLVTASGGLALLAGMVLLAVAAGTTDLTVILAEPETVLASPLAPAIGALIIVAAVTKSALVPAHSWLPGAMAAITPVSAYLHAATMVKAGIYLLMRFSGLFAGEAAWSAALLIIGLASAVFGAAWALRQHDLKRLLAYSTVSQLGLLTAAIGVGTPTALSAAILHTLAHALFKATLFMLVGIIDHEAGSRDIRELSGLRRVMPVTAAMTGLAGLSMAGVPPLLGFVSKEYLFQGFLDADVTPWAGPAAGAVAVIASALTFAYGLRIFYGAFGGPTVQTELYEPARAFLAPAAFAALLGLVLGPAVGLLDPIVGWALVDVYPTAGEVSFYFWHGLSPELAMTAITIAIGLGLFLARARVERVLLRIPVAGNLFERGYEGLLRFGALVGRPDRTGSPASILVRPVLGLIALGTAAALALDNGPLPGLVGDHSAAPDWPILVLLVIVVLGCVMTGSALTALALLGTAGLVVALWFLLAGAPDVAMTLLLVEVLTAVVAVLVLTRLPARFRRPRPRRAVGSAAVAVLAGLAAAGATLLFTGARDISPVGDYFLRRAEPETGGRNVVNTILVDFRGLDTLGEAAVLGAVTLGLLMLLGSRSVPEAGRTAPPADALVMRVAFRMLAPVMLALSAYLFLRGHYQPGGGFIAALVAGTAIAFGYLASGRVPGRGSRLLRPGPLTAGGLILSIGTALTAHLVGEAFFTPLRGSLDLPVIGYLPLTSSLLFDLGIYLFVLGLVLAAVDRLGDGLPGGFDPSGGHDGSGHPSPGPSGARGAAVPPDGDGKARETTASGTTAPADETVESPGEARR
ncbi:DUF4040 domain-containing protein [Streptomyces alkaliphilus]|uniref:DUF4040 domain-containing protein n=1 Tax=Streptomyces alkaliphilus TaxID=1472722 RepID=A0A7W3Y0J5_9ACTN|nr:hydrogen gas-evolving membrane-bound hydrogenase subunit E [Streptomyces alkaliphilus]MBB0243265.1 DUF4040 domain-containing protein [Streptomyces alkaliphilus]